MLLAVGRRYAAREPGERPMLIGDLSRPLVGPNVGLTGPPGVVSPYPNHDNHLHVRIGAG